MAPVGRLSRATDTARGAVEETLAVAAIEKDQPEVVISGFNGKVGDVVLAISPRLMNRIGWSGPFKILKSEGERREALRAAGERDMPN
jgi:hypothetical protein